MTSVVILATVWFVLAINYLIQNLAFDYIDRAIVRSYEPQTLRPSNHTNAEHPFWEEGVLFASLSSRWATTIGRLLGPDGKLT